MTAVPSVARLLVAVAAVAGGVRLAQRRLQHQALRAAALERDVARLGATAQQALRLRDEFLATLSHELRTPLNAVLGWLELLRLHADDAPLRARAIDVIERNALAQVRLVEDLLDVSQIISGRMRLRFERLNMTDIVRAAADALGATAAAKSVTLVVNAEPMHGTVRGDAARLQQVVWNLISNAVKFTPRGGRVTVYLLETPVAAEVRVTDTGIGVPPEVLPYVFDRFRQGDSSLSRPYGGLGLGLALVRHLVELHGGSVSAASGGHNRGATFTVRLPIARSGG